MLKHTTKIVAAFVQNNPIPDLAELIHSVHSALVSAGAPEPAQAGEKQQPAVSIKRSVKPDGIVCLECGRTQQMMKRHLQTAHGHSVDDYRSKWGLPADYPMTAPNYALRRSELAKAAGLGTMRKKA
jgi:predicted transcriptional regulator